ncbi:MAG TPA: hypothetical protein VNF08_00560 [Acidimicrobiales bacterium]|nr:hypothetical protein [Acidimicrobiales bacterium]
MKTEGRPVITRAHVLTHGLGVGVIALVLMVAGGVVSVAQSASGSAARHVAAKASSVPCTSMMVRERAATNETSYGPGSVVRMSASLHNTSSQTCSIAVGATSPSLIVKNASGVEEWSTCGATGGLQACALYLMLETLQPGGTYTRTATWDQHSSASATRAPPGVYRLSVHFNGVTGQASTKFNLTALTPPRTVTVTEADSGHRYSLTRGTRLVVQLSGPAIYTWTEPVSSNPAVLKRTVSSSANPAITTFIAQKKGVARVTAVGNPKCYPQCLMPSRVFTIIVSVAE